MTPIIKVNQEYIHLLKDCDSPETLVYPAQKKQLEWVQQCILQRNQTLLALGNLIFETQQSFSGMGLDIRSPLPRQQPLRHLGLHCRNR